MIRTRRPDGGADPRHPTPHPLAFVTVSVASFGVAPDGERVDVFTLSGASGIEVRVLTLGGIIVSLCVPDRDGGLDDVVLGYDSVEGYGDPRTPYFGAIIGRYANRIAEGRFTLDGEEYRLAATHPPNALHGGVKGFDKVCWQGDVLPAAGGDAVRLRYTSADGEEGYPGTVRVEVVYTLDDRGALAVDYRASTDRATPLNLTQHSYFNLGGHASGDVLGHELTLRAGRFTPVDATLIPTGELAPVDGTPFDFRRGQTIGSRIHEPHPQLLIADGYDHNFVLNGGSGGKPAPAARLHDPRSGRTLEVTTTEPGLQLYTGNALDGTLRGKGGHVYGARAGVCLETQHFPDSPNHPAFPSTILRPGADFRSRTIFTFGVAPRAGGGRDPS